MWPIHLLFLFLISDNKLSFIYKIKFWNDSLKIQFNKSMSQNNNFAYRVQEQKKLTGLVSSNDQSMQAHEN